MRATPGLFLMFLMLVSHASAATADAPVLYLRCKVTATADAPANQVDFTLNESNGTVVVGGTGSTSQAAFGPDHVSWHDDLSNNSSLERSINRTDLSFTETLNLMGGLIKRTQTGSCTVVHPPKRKI